MRIPFVLLLLSSVACSRQVRVETAPSAATATSSVKVTNTTAQAVSIYVTAGGPELFLKQVAANATEIVPVPGVADGTTVRLRAMLADGSRSYTKEGVVLSGVYDWRVP